MRGSLRPPLFSLFVFTCDDIPSSHVISAPSFLCLTLSCCGQLGASHLRGGTRASLRRPARDPGATRSARRTPSSSTSSSRSRAKPWRFIWMHLTSLVPRAFRCLSGCHLAAFLCGTQQGSFGGRWLHKVVKVIRLYKVVKVIPWDLLVVV